MKAVILAAGCATRLRPHTDDLPKTLLPVAGVPILRRTITSLSRLGFDSFVIGTGYLEHLVQTSVAEWFGNTLDIQFVTNPVFRSTNNAYSLSLCRELVDGHPFLLIDGDVVFDSSVVEQLLERGTDCLSVRSIGGIGLEEVKVTADAEDRIREIGKHVPVRTAMGESVGIELFSAESSRRLFAALDRRVHQQGLVNEYYEASFQEIIDEGAPLYGVDIGNRYATEIDTYEDLVAANARMSERPAFDLEVGIRVAV